MGRNMFWSRLRAFVPDERGVTAVEYGMMLVIFSLVVTTALSTLGTGLVGLFQKIADLFA